MAPTMPARGQDGDALPAAVRRRTLGTRAARAPGTAAHQVGERGARVEDDEAFGGAAGGRPALLLARSRGPLAGAQGLLLAREPQAPEGSP
jgi:hypothetical protein